VNVSLSRIILYVNDVRSLAAFYRDALGMRVVEEIADGWAVLAAGPCELALHAAGEAHRGPRGGWTGANSNAKLVLDVAGDVSALRERLLARGVPMREIKSFAGVAGRFTDGTDPEGNVFQLSGE
jgi:catechol 2,3-dioxygenase-like lactoylglutathione lyase family enzyme